MPEGEVGRQEIPPARAPFGDECGSAAFQVPIGSAAELEVAGAEILVLPFRRQDQLVAAGAEHETASNLTAEPRSPAEAVVGPDVAEAVAVDAVERLALDAHAPDRGRIEAVAEPGAHRPGLGHRPVRGVGAREGEGVAAVERDVVVDVASRRAGLEVAEPNDTLEAEREILEPVAIAGTSAQDVDAVASRP